MVNKFLYPFWKSGGNILSYNQLHFSEDQERVQRFFQLPDLYTAHDVLIGFPELQKLLNASAWRSLPPIFADLLSQHRHSHLNMVGDTQNLMFIDQNLRRHISELYICQTMLRFPANEAIKPLLHWIRVVHKTRVMDEKSDTIRYKKIDSHFYYISRFWTKDLYDTYEKSNLSEYSLWAEQINGKWSVHMVSRQLIAGGQARSR